MLAERPCCSAARAIALLGVVALLAEGCSLVHREPSIAPPTQAPPIGLASWYGEAFHGRRTASGERFDQHGLTAASLSLPIGARARVTNLDNGRSVVVRINDRGPYVRRRVLDLSYAAARALGMVRRGTARVHIEVLDGATTLRADATRVRWRGR